MIVIDIIPVVIIVIHIYIDSSIPVYGRARSIKMVVGRAERGMEHWGAPPSTRMRSVKANTHEAYRHSPAETPSCPGIITHCEPISNRPWIIIRTIPGVIIKPGPVYDRGPVNIASCIARQVTHVHHIRCRLIDVNVFNIINGIFRRNILDICRYLRGNSPWAHRGIADKPNRIIAYIITLVGHDHGTAGV